MPGGKPQEPNEIAMDLSKEAHNAVVQRMKQTGNRKLLERLRHDLNLELVGFGADPRFKYTEKGVLYDVNILRSDSSGQVQTQVTFVVTARKTIVRGASQFDVPSAITITRLVFY